MSVSLRVSELRHVDKPWSRNYCSFALKEPVEDPRVKQELASEFVFY